MRSPPSGSSSASCRFFTTTYRLTPTHVQVRSGVLNRRTLSVPRDRIRSVDVDSTLLHRIFGLAIVKVGTGASHGQDELEFNAVALRDVPALRSELLRTRAADAAEVKQRSPANLSHWQPGWVRYAPLTLSGVASIFAVVAFLFQVQFFEGGLVTRLPIVQQAIGFVSHLPVLTTALWGAAGLVVVASVVAMVRYALSYGGFGIHRVDATTLHINHGLLRTRQITLDETRLRGVQLSEPLSLRAVGAALRPRDHDRTRQAARLRRTARPARASRHGPCASPRTFSAQPEPLEADLIQHGPRARRRRFTRAATFAGILALGALVLELLGIVGPSIWWAFVVIVPASALLAVDRYRGLGHRLLPGSPRRPKRLAQPQADGAGHRGDHRVDHPAHVLPASGGPCHPDRHDGSRKAPVHDPRPARRRRLATDRSGQPQGLRPQGVAEQLDHAVDSLITGEGGRR